MSATPRKFRFAAGGEGNSDEGGARKFVGLAQQAEEMGYDTFAVPDRLGPQVGPIAALGALSQTTSKIRLATSMLAAPMRHPVVLAKELTTIDVLSKGRLEVGISAGGFRDDFEAAGIEYESPRNRIARLDETLQVLDSLLRGQETSVAGEKYQVEKAVGYPRPRQGPRPPIAIGAGGTQMLRLAARHADIVSVACGSTPQGKLKLSDMTIDKTIARVEVVRDAAGERFDDIELSWTIATIVVTDDRRQMAEYALEGIKRGLSPNIEMDIELTVDDILESPYLALGTFDEIAEQVRTVRERTSMSYVGVFPTQMEAFYPVLEQLKGD